MSDYYLGKQSLDAQADERAERDWANGTGHCIECGGTYDVEDMRDFNTCNECAADVPEEFHQ